MDADGNVIASSTVCHEVLVECCTLPFEWFANADGCQVCYSPIYEGPNPTSCVLWNFGDGTWGWGVNPCHTYNASGVYDVCMYAWCCDDVDVVVDPTNVDGVIDLIADLDAQGLLATICHPVTVQCDCTVPCDVHASFNQELSNSTVQFTNTSSSGPGTTIVSYFWDFGDGNTSNLEHPLHTYAQTGTYLVCLTVTAVGEDGSTCTDTFCFPVTIPCVGDLDGNGVVNILDVLMVLGAYGMQCP
ncbi:MAG: PKD domain-containing protein, partial [Flavobacteriales bacterium]|nr:PKD domain-containing protein [Flavobacteriales bacterium]